jgi:EmrB/QacA subfamily drug resistance transporter
MLSSKPATGAHRSPAAKWAPLVAISLGTFMLLIDITIVIVALTSIQRDLNSGFADLQWVVDAYALVLAAFVVGAGSLADGVGHRNTYLAGTALFALASLAAGLAPNIGILIAARSVQGLAAAAMFATTVSLLYATYSGRDRGTAFAVWGAVSGASAGLGMLLGGVLTEWLGWRTIFFVNLPVSIVAIVLTVATITNQRHQSRLRLDLPGPATFSAGAAALTFAIIRGGEQGWTDTTTLWSFGIALVLLVLFVIIEAVVSNPMVPLGLFRIRPFSGSLIGALGQSFAAFGTAPLIAIWAHDVLGLTALQTGLAMLPLSAVSFVTSIGMRRMRDGLHPAVSIGASLVLVGVGALLLLLIGPESTWVSTVPGMVLAGIGVGVASPALMTVALSSVQPKQTGVASGTVNMGRQFGYALGVAVLGSVFATAAGSSHPANLTDHLRGLDVAWIVAGVAGVVLGVITIAILWSGHSPASDQSWDDDGSWDDGDQPWGDGDQSWADGTSSGDSSSGSGSSWGGEGSTQISTGKR